MKKGMCPVLLVTCILILMPFGSRLDAADPPALSIDWTHYHNHTETIQIMKSLSEAYPNLSKVYTFGKSFQGQDLWLIEITNYATGTPETKPGMWIDGNTHGGEVSGAEVCLYTINHLVTKLSFP